MANTTNANAALRDDLLAFSAALFFHDHAAIQATYALHPGVDVMAAAASLFVENKKGSNSTYNANIDSLTDLILLRFATERLEFNHISLRAWSPNSGHSHLAGYVYGGPLRGGMPAKKVVATLDLLERLGWIPCEEALYEFSQKAIYAQQISPLLWLARRGLRLRAKPLEEGHFFNGVAVAFQNPSAKDLCVLGELCDLGALRDADGEVGVTDFIAVNAYKAAAVLAAKGFKPRPTTCRVAGINPVCCYLNSLSQVLGRDDSSRRARRSNQITATLDWMASNGADFSPSPIPGVIENSWNPFLSASEAIYFANITAPEQDAQIRRIFADLARLGSNPNVSGGFIHSEIRRLHRVNFNTLSFDAAIAAGADPHLHPGPALAAIAHWERGEPVWTAWLNKLAALGAVPADAPVSCPAQDHPLASAIVHRRIQYAKRLLDAGIDTSWTDSERGDTLWHLLAQQGGAFSVPLIQRLAKDPAAAPLVDARAGDGSTALHLACAALNTAQAKALLDAGASPTAQDSLGQSPLHCAGRKFGAKALAKTSDLIELLMARGADPSLLNKKGLTAGQAMAKRAPLEGLAILLNARPSDLLGESAESLSTQHNLSRRGAQAISIVESAILGSEDTAPKPEPKAKKQRL